MGARVAHPHRRGHMEAACPHPCRASSSARAAPGRDGSAGRAVEHLLRSVTAYPSQVAPPPEADGRAMARCLGQ
eukprot:2454257-Lingulodinium_polyedra.AAC.1